MSVSLTRVTRGLASEALQLHRLALAVEDVASLESPVSGLRAEDGIDRPTEHAALCDRRMRVVASAHEMIPVLHQLRETLSQVIADWEGTAP